MEKKYIELLTNNGLFYKETLFHSELIKYSEFSDEYQTIFKRKKYNFDFLDKYQIMTNIIIAARNIDPSDNANFFNNMERLFEYNPLDQTIIVITHDTFFVKPYLKALNLNFRCLEIDLSLTATMPLLREAFNVSSPKTEFYMISFFNQKYIGYDKVAKLIDEYENKKDKNIFIPIIDGKFSNPTILKRGVMERIANCRENVGLSEFLNRDKSETLFINF